MARSQGRLYKDHVSGCTNTAAKGQALENCECQWSGQYKNKFRQLRKALDREVKPRSWKAGNLALGDFRGLIDKKLLDEPRHLHKGIGALRFLDLMRQWVKKEVENPDAPHTSNSIYYQLGVLGYVSEEDEQNGAKPYKHGLHAVPLGELVKGGKEDGLIHTWLKKESTRRNGWSASNSNHYRGLIYTICEFGTLWEIGDEPVLARNPVKTVPVRPETEQDHYSVRLDDVQRTRPGVPEETQLSMLERLLFWCDRLDDPRPVRFKVSLEQADEIRRRVAGGEMQKTVAALFGISPATCSLIASGLSRNPANYVKSTYAAEMKRRVIAAHDGGIRKGEMQRVQIKHINWRPTQLVSEDGKVVVEVITIKLPPAISKGGKSSGKVETIYATGEFRAMLEARYLQLGRQPEAYVFGTEAGRFQADFEKPYHRLFDLAGIVQGRGKGAVWHTFRGEFCSLAAELCGGDPALLMKLGRFKDLKTAQRYLKTRESRVLEVAAAIGRAGRSGGRPKFSVVSQ